MMLMNEIIFTELSEALLFNNEVRNAKNNVNEPLDFMYAVALKTYEKKNTHKTAYSKLNIYRIG